MKRQGAKERLMETASRLFYTQGYNQTGINQILKESAVAKASMYQHFRSKEDMAVEYLERRHHMWMANLNSFVLDKDAGVDRILASFDFLKEWLTEVDFVGCGFQNIVTDLPKEQKKIQNVVRKHKDELREWIHAALKKVEDYRIEETENKGDQILMLIEGAIISALIQRHVWPIDSARNGARCILK